MSENPFLTQTDDVTDNQNTATVEPDKKDVPKDETKFNDNAPVGAVDESLPPNLDHDQLVDRGNHENDPAQRETHVNDDGHLVDQDGNYVYTTFEQALRDGMVALDSKGRQPGLYLDDLEELERLDLRERTEALHKAATHRPIVQRDVNVVNSPLPPVTVASEMPQDAKSPVDVLLDATGKRRDSE